jgi:hypothetical protein
MDLTGADTLLVAASTATGAIVTQFFNYLKQRRQDNQRHETEEDDRVIAGYQLTITKLDNRIDALEKAYDKMRREHVDCIVVQAELRGEIAALHKQIGNNPNAAFPSAVNPPPIAPPPHRNSPHITPHNPESAYQQISSIPTRSIEPLDQK